MLSLVKQSGVFLGLQPGVYCTDLNILIVYCMCRSEQKVVADCKDSRWCHR